MWQGPAAYQSHTGVWKMIRLQDGELADFLPVQMKNSTDMVCLSHALRKAAGRLLGYEKSAMVYNFIDSLPEQVLDVLAVEIRSPYYLDSMDLDTKRGIVKNTFLWHAKAGTPSAVEELLGVTFGEGEVKEWFEYGGKPYWFKVGTAGILTKDNAVYFSEMLQRVKNTRSHVQVLEIYRETGQDTHAGAGMSLLYRPAPVMDGYRVRQEADQAVHAGTAGVTAGCRPAPVMDGFKHRRSMPAAVQAASGGTCIYKHTVME